MKITEQQLLILFSIIKGTCRIEGIIGDFTVADRLKLVNDILHQQGNAVVDVVENCSTVT
jgi:hypothetical protein